MIFPFFKKIRFLDILGPPYCGIGATIRIGREMLCLQYKGFFRRHLKKAIKKVCSDFLTSVGSIDLKKLLETQKQTEKKKTTDGEATPQERQQMPQEDPPSSNSNHHFSTRNLTSRDHGCSTTIDLVSYRRPGLASVEIH